jgi:hypothetical protein
MVYGFIGIKDWSGRVDLITHLKRNKSRGGLMVGASGFDYSLKEEQIQGRFNGRGEWI